LINNFILSCRWVHTSCDNITPEIYERLQVDPRIVYVCKVCREEVENIKKDHQTSEVSSCNSVAMTLAPFFHTSEIEIGVFKGIAETFQHMLLKNETKNLIIKLVGRKIVKALRPPYSPKFNTVRNSF